MIDNEKICDKINWKSIISFVKEHNSYTIT